MKFFVCLVCRIGIDGIYRSWGVRVNRASSKAG
jgi:hypothetical protein